MRKLVYLALALMILCAVTTAWADDTKNRFRFCIGSSQPTGDLRFLEVEDSVGSGGTVAAAVLAGEAYVDPQSDISYMLGYERILNDRIGIEFGAMYADHDMDITETFGIYDDVAGRFIDVFDTETYLAGMDMNPFTVGMNVHVLNNEKVDLFLGPMIGYTFFGDFKVNDPGGLTRLSVDDDFTYGATVGVDIPFENRKFFFTAMARYMAATADVQIPSEMTEGEPFTLSMDVDPYSIDLGFGVRF